MINGGHKEEFRVSESEGTMTHQFDFVVHSFEAFIGDPEFGPGQQTGQIIFKQAPTR